MDIKSFIQNPYESNKFIEFITNIFGSFEPNRADFDDEELSESERKNIEGFRYLGNIILNDDKEIGIFEFLSKTPNIENKRVSFNQVLKKLAKDYILDGAIATFFHPESSSFRLSFVGIEYDVEKLKVTNLKRYTYLLGKGIPTKTAYLQLKKLKYPNYEELKDAFSVEAVSKEFYEKYRNLFEKINEEIKNSGQFGYFEKKETNLHYFSKKLLGRIIFLYFLQKKGWLGVSKNDTWGDGSKNFLFEKFRKYRDRNFYDDFLKKVFFEALNTKRENDYFKELNCKMPFLNGGLFEKDRFDKLDIYLENSLFEEIFSTFNQYNFTIIEDSKDDKEVAIDPEMMGRVFENLLEENYRKGKGAFYTPREIVYYMCEKAIIDYLANFFDKERIKDLVIENRTDNSYIKREAKNIKEKLLNIKIADIAIGSGAFPMGMLQTIISILENLDKTIDDKDKAKLKRKIIENSIFGIDIDSSAVEIAKLRFWLSLVVDEDRPFPLPNLYYKIMVGNSLFEKIYEIDLFKKDNQLFDDMEEKIKEIQKLIHKFYNESDKNKKEDLKNVIEAKIDEIVLKEIEKQEDFINGRINNANPLKGLTKEQSDFIEEAQKKISILEKIKHRPTTELFFYKIYFAEVLNSGGFDVVIGNPPYIRQEKLKDIKDRLKAEGYRCFTSAADIYIYFFEKGYNLLSENGILSYITSNKYTRAKYGAKFREFLLKNCNILEYIDFNGVKVFESATVDTSILSFSNNSREDNHLLYCDVQDDYQKGENLFSYVEKNGFLYPQSALSKDSFSFASPKELKIKERIEKIGTPLKEWDVKINYGIKTGLNEAFIIDTKTKDEILSNCKSEDERERTKNIIKPILRGRDIKRYSYKWAGLWVIVIPAGWTNANKGAKNANDFMEETFPLLMNHLNQFREKAKRRADKGDYWWELRRCAYYDEFEKEKLIYPNMAKSLIATYNPNKFYTNQKCFIITGKNIKYLTALFNSIVVFWYFKNIGATLGSAGYEMSKIFIERLPIPQISDTKPFEVLVDFIQELKSKDDIRAKFFEDAVDIMVYELYFKDELEKNGFAILDIVKDDLEKGADIDKLFKKWSDREHKIKKAVEFIDTLEIVKIVEKR